MKNEFAVGQELVCVDSGRSGDVWEVVTVSKVGKKWVYFLQYGREHKFDSETMIVDAGAYTSHSKMYLSYQHYIDERELNLTREKFFRQFELEKWNLQRSLTKDQMEAVTKILFEGK